MRIILGLLYVIAITVAFAGCDKEEMSQEPISPAVIEEAPQPEVVTELVPVQTVQEEAQPEQVEEAPPATPVVEAEQVPAQTEPAPEPQPAQAEQAPPAAPVAEAVPAEPQPEPAPEPQPAAAPAAADVVVATVNGTAITESDVSEEVDKRLKAMKKRAPEGQEIPEQQKQQIRMRVVDMLAQKVVLDQELAKRNITISDEKVIEEITKIAGERGQSLDEVKTEIAQHGMTIDDLVSQVRPQIQMKELSEARQSEPQMQAEAKKFYDDNPSYFKVPEQVRASHILLGKRGIKPEEKPEYLAQITEVEAKLKAGESFEDLAKEHSTCPSSAKGGDLDFFGKGSMDPAFEKVAFELEVGQTSGIVETSFGYHIIKVTDKNEAGTKSLKEVQPQIVGYLLQQQIQKDVTIEYSAEEQALRDQAKQQQQMQQQMMQQMQAQMAQRQAAQQEQEKTEAQKQAEGVSEEAAEPAPAPVPEN